ncbi:uncharacterized protein PGTG_17050 [Puccinia graminis f. sp. tritici CRL 75-36-700-3]|uniref:Uncharacterized protein n=1 Tax=Puccinia graminis f. sp. tritici (strain CRL 75-36-700-3 / race SCCL) TaxID=418459 RepID=E3L2T5_PUCGT|nr:uncharacterized protein PGTG_17050 [Puccinia graminis f. sp. tritici CRL 75-36-700-3]EFP90851.1 hypothetical protein PGTG_17050 [Puccinia graminis f. sp. tritici CRL 75-36-700-3]
MKPGPKTVPRPDPANVAVWVGSGHKVNIAAQTRPTWGSRRVRVGSGRPLTFSGLATGLEMVEGYPSRIPVIRWRIPACANGYPPAGADSGADGPFSANRRRVSGYPKGYPRPGGEMAGWKEALPVDEVQVPRRCENSFGNGGSPVRGK